MFKTTYTSNKILKALLAQYAHVEQVTDICRHTIFPYGKRDICLRPFNGTFYGIVTYYLSISLLPLPCHFYLFRGDI